MLTCLAWSTRVKNGVGWFWTYWFRLSIRYPPIQSLPLSPIYTFNYSHFCLSHILWNLYILLMCYLQTQLEVTFSIYWVKTLRIFFKKRIPFFLSSIANGSPSSVNDHSPVLSFLFTSAVTISAHTLIISSLFTEHSSASDLVSAEGGGSKRQGLNESITPSQSCSLDLKVNTRIMFKRQCWCWVG